MSGPKRSLDPLTYVPGQRNAMSELENRSADDDFAAMLESQQQNARRFLEQQQERFEKLESLVADEIDGIRGTIDEWVERGEAPEQLPTLYRDATGQQIGAGRIVCSWPSVVTYQGQGDPREPDSFSCSDGE